MLTADDKIYFLISITRARSVQLLQQLGNRGINFAVVVSTVGDEDFAVDTSSCNTVSPVRSVSFR